MASKSGFELLFAQEQKQEQEQQQQEKPKQQVEENYIHERQSHGTLKAQGLTSSGCCPIFAGAGEISGASIMSELQSHGTLKAQGLTSSGCCPFLPGVAEIVQQGSFGAPVFIDGLAPPPAEFMYIMVPMENVVAREAVDVAATAGVAFGDKASVSSAAVPAANVSACAGAGDELRSMPRNALRYVQGRLLPPPPEGLPPPVPAVVDPVVACLGRRRRWASRLPKLDAFDFAKDPAVLCYGLSGQECQQRISVPSSKREEWTLDDELLAAMEAREDRELGFDAMNDQTFGGGLKEWSFDFVVESEEFHMGVFVGRSREPRMCRCAVDALKRKKRCKRFRRVGFAEDVIINESEREEIAVTMEEESREAAGGGNLLHPRRCCTRSVCSVCGVSSNF